MTSFLSIVPLWCERCGFTWFYMSTQKPGSATCHEKLYTLVQAAWHYKVSFSRSWKLQTHRQTHTQNTASNIIHLRTGWSFSLYLHSHAQEYTMACPPLYFCGHLFFHAPVYIPLFWIPVTLPWTPVTVLPPLSLSWYCACYRTLPFIPGLPNFTIAPCQ